MQIAADAMPVDQKVGSRGYNEHREVAVEDRAQMTPEENGVRILEYLRENPWIHMEKWAVRRACGLSTGQFKSGLETATRFDACVAEDDDGKIVYCEGQGGVLEMTW